MQTLHIFLIISIQLLRYQLCNSRFAEEMQGCNLDFGGIGTCIHIKNCPEAIKQIHNGGHPKICAFDGIYPIVCCETKSFRISNDHGSTATQKEEHGDNSDSGRIGDYVHIEERPEAIKQINDGNRSKIFETASSKTANDDGSIAKQKEEQGDNLDSERSDDYVHIKECPDAIKQVNDGNCSKIFETVSSKTANDDGSIAKQKCQEYTITSVPTTTTTTTTTSPPSGTRFKYSRHKGGHGIGGVNAKPLEFPHMAILGYGSSDDMKWQCGGSLISENFVLTAAHCIHSKHGDVQHIRLGLHRLRYTFKFEEAFTVKQTYLHPNYSRSQDYHDIALIELDHSANIQSGVKPACLQTEKQLPTNIFQWTGWGAVKLYGGIHNTLQKGNLSHVPTENCTEYYNRLRRLRNGVVDNWQMCAHGGGVTDTCQGDSGGPLQTKLPGDSLFTIVGITSTGIKCAVVPGIYTRVSYYVPWIESIVWPEESAST